ncbi:MAG: leucine-rich repeat domain-containing protein [Bacteroides sp.]|nr:leucine-rich repeat domain-containing protein [Bacteroides sp.]
MKKTLLLSLIALLGATAATARNFNYAYEGQTLTYTVLDEDAKTCQTKAGSNGVPGNRVSGKLIIPEKASDGSNEYTVTTIGESAFYYCSSLTSVTIPNSVTTIGKSAFYYCSSLTKAEFTSIESLCNISFSSDASNPLRYAKNLYINGKEIKDLAIPESVTSIGNYAFYNCSGLTSVTIPESVTTIGEFAFRYCSGLTSVTIPNSVTSIGKYAFYCCSGLTSVIIPNSVTSIEWCAFDGCSGLTSVTIPNSVTSIGSSAFSSCSGLTSVTIPNSVTSIGESAFDDCSGLTSVTIPNSVTSIGESAFSGCSSLTSVTIPNSVTSIKRYTFDDCSGLTSVTIPNSVTSIGTGAFFGCTSLTSVTIPTSVTSIGSAAFYKCTNLTSVTIPNSVTSIDASAFEGCASMKKVAKPSSVSYSFGSNAMVVNYNKGNAYADADGFVWSNDNTELLFVPCSLAGSYSIPNSVTSIGANAFRYCSDLTSVTIPTSVTAIGEYAFDGCRGLTVVEYLSEEPCTANKNIFSSTIYENATLHIPQETLDTYSTTTPWNLFKNIVEEVWLSAIGDVTVDNATIGAIDYSAPYDVYNFQGIRVAGSTIGLAPGIYIIRQGIKTAKIVIK